MANMLRAARLALGLTQQQAARLTGEDQGDISKFESGKLDPRFSRAQRYLNALRAAAESGKATVLSAKPAPSACRLPSTSSRSRTYAAAITNLKLQKLLYDGQGDSLAICDQRLFVERIKRWEHGPVVPQVWEGLHGQRRRPPPRAPTTSTRSTSTRRRGWCSSASPRGSAR